MIQFVRASPRIPAIPRGGLMHQRSRRGGSDPVVTLLPQLRHMGGQDEPSVPASAGMFLGTHLVLGGVRVYATDEEAVRIHVKRPGRDLARTHNAVALVPVDRLEPFQIGVV